MEDKRGSRFNLMRNVIIVVFIVIFSKILYMTTYKYEHYTELAENKTYKLLPIKAPRGEIRDKNGKLLAGNKNLFTVQVSGDGLDKEDENGDSMANDISLELMRLLRANDEEYIDEFPITISKDGKYEYTFDQDIIEWKELENIPMDLNAEQSFYYVVDRLIAEGSLDKSDRNLDKLDLQAKVNQSGKYPPILVSKGVFTAERDKQDWLKSYGIKDTNISAEDAFKEIREEYYEIDSTVSDSDARDILIVRDLVKSQGFTQYRPVTVAQDISEDTIVQIEERGINLPGVSVEIEPVRYYPNGPFLAHALGYVGKIPAAKEEEYLEKGYNKSDIVGQTGIELYYEDELRGTDGYKKVQVDAYGKVTNELEVVEPISGDTVYLSIDKELQEVAEDSLEKAIDIARTGGTYKSKYGDRAVAGGAIHTQTGATIAVDVKTGDVLAMASFPDYDPNELVMGMSQEYYRYMQGDNPNDVLGARPQTNLVTQAPVQPGSTFKLITGMAAMESGLSPNFAINDPGYYKFSPQGRPFADLIWHKSRSTHGYTDMYHAIQESCNLYFYAISTGLTIGGNKTNVEVGPETVLEYAKMFGLDEKTGLHKEMSESKGVVPSTEQKLINTQNQLRDVLDKEMENAFTDINKEDDNDEYDERIDEIVGWAAETNTPGKFEVMDRLIDMKVEEDKADDLSDTIVFDYLNFAKWTHADTFNLSIGQGENLYTPAQIVRFTAAIANGGNLVELSTVDKVISSDYTDVDINDKETEKIPLKDDENLQHLKKGMIQGVEEGTSTILSTLGIDIAAKTGSAEKSGKIPTDNEVEYLKSHMGSYGVNTQEAEKLAEKLKKEREEELTEERIEYIKEELERKDLDKDERESLQKELYEGVSVKLDDSDKTQASFLRKAIKELNENIDDEDIDDFKPDYDAFSWNVTYAPADDPEIAVVTMIPQADTSSISLLVTREIIGEYLGIGDKIDEEQAAEENENLDEDEINQEMSDENMNFGTSMKK